ncbi:hypothetical protein CITRIK5_60011 [Citricoccus sp. K5]|nr:hypothetical protein CITRIK5_60011 [Citricoccus sp. K5]
MGTRLSRNGDCQSVAIRSRVARSSKRSARKISIGATIAVPDMIVSGTLIDTPLGNLAKSSMHFSVAAAEGEATRSQRIFT